MTQKDIEKKLKCLEKSLKDLSFINNFNTITVNSYEDAISHFSGDITKFIAITSDASYNDGDKSLYIYIPGFGTAQILADFDYTTP